MAASAHSPLFFYVYNPRNVSVDLSPSDGVPFTLNGTIAIAPDACPVKIPSPTTRAIMRGRGGRGGRGGAGAWA
jgi:hypothetical protein